MRSFLVWRLFVAFKAGFPNTSRDFMNRLASIAILARTGCKGAERFLASLGPAEPSGMPRPKASGWTPGVAAGEDEVQAGVWDGHASRRLKRDPSVTMFPRDDDPWWGRQFVCVV